MSFLVTLWSAVLWLLTRLGLVRPLYRAIHVDDVPDKLQPYKVYVAGEDGHAWSAAMLCPGGCGRVLEMNLLPDANPVWKLVEAADRRVTLSPSVWLKTDCGCHYFVQEGRIKWV